MRRRLSDYEKRLAVRTEDHPLDDVGFEGTIPADEYGGGAVVVCDAGTWRPRIGDVDPDSDDEIAEAIDDALDEGHLSFDVDGEKLHGGYLLHVRNDEDRDDR